MDCINIKVGDKVWISQQGRREDIETVIRLTNTLIITDGGGRGEDEFTRYYRTSGYQRAHLSWRSAIEGIATPAEIKAYEKQKADAAAAQRRFDQAQADRKQRQLEMVRGLPERIYATVDDAGARWVLHGLTTEEIEVAVATLRKRTAR